MGDVILSGTGTAAILEVYAVSAGLRRNVRALADCCAWNYSPEEIHGSRCESPGVSPLKIIEIIYAKSCNLAHFWTVNDL